MEQRRTKQFLKFALGKREEKTEDELKTDMMNKKYNPMVDPLMPRLFRKVNHLSLLSSGGSSLIGNSLSMTHRQTESKS